MAYQELLKDPRWQKKRLEILQRDNFTCTCCGDTKSTLHVHHVKYNGNPWDVDSSLLITFCEVCHFAHEFYNNRIIRKIKKYPRKDGVDILFIFCDTDVVISMVKNSEVFDHVALGSDFIRMLHDESLKYLKNG